MGFVIEREVGELELERFRRFIVNFIGDWKVKTIQEASHMKGHFTCFISVTIMQVFFANFTFALLMKLRSYTHFIDFIDSSAFIVAMHSSLRNS